MSYKKCKECNGTGKVECEVHGTHTCPDCNGKGCTEGGKCPFDIDPWKHLPYDPKPYPSPKRPWYYKEPFKIWSCQS